MEFLLKRVYHNNDYTIGKLYADGIYLCDTIEDIERAVKVKGKTAIPKGRYKIILTMSNRFKRILPLLLNVPGFDGRRTHGGNTELDTDGCILPGENKVKGKVINSKKYEVEIIKLLQNSTDNYITIEVMETLIELRGHTHARVIPPRDFAGKLTPVLKTKAVLSLLDWVNPLDNLFPNQFSPDILSRLKVFNSYEGKTDEEVIDELVSQSPNAIIILKIMDLSCMGAGPVKQSIMSQVITIHKLKLTKYPQLRLFPMLDPRSEYKARLLSYMRVFHKDFAGFTVYPNVGYTILDIGLEGAFDWATLHKKSVMVHCTADTPIYYKGSKDTLTELLYPLKRYNFYVESKNTQKACSNFAHPTLTYIAAKKHKEVNFNLCHMGGHGNPEWNELCDNCMYYLENVWGDWSSRVRNPDDLNNVLSASSAKTKMFPGDDWYMLVMWEQRAMYELEKQYYKYGLRFLNEA